MKIVVNSITVKIGGALTYLENFLKILSRIDKTNFYIIYCPRKIFKEYQKVCGRIILRTAPLAEKNSFFYFLWLQIWLPLILKKEKADLLISQLNFGPFFSPCPHILLVRNSLYFSPLYEKKIISNSYFGLLMLKIKRWISLKNIKSADIVIYPSKAMKEMVKNYVKVNPRKEKVIYHGFSSFLNKKNNFEKKDLILKKENFEKILNKTRKKQIILTVSGIAEHKNIPVLVKAIPFLAKNSQFDFVFLFFGARNKFSLKKLSEEIKKLKNLGLEKKFIDLGDNIKKVDFRLLYQKASLFVFPSYLESFGHPLLEAMDANLPIISADIPTNREICQNASLYFSCFDPKDLANKIESVLVNDKIRDELVEKGKKRIKDFSWEVHIKKLLEIANNLIKNGKP